MLTKGDFPGSFLVSPSPDFPDHHLNRQPNPSASQIQPLPSHQPVSCSFISMLHFCFHHLLAMFLRNKQECLLFILCRIWPARVGQCERNVTDRFQSKIQGFNGINAFSHFAASKPKRNCPLYFGLKGVLPPYESGSCLPSPRILGSPLHRSSPAHVQSCAA